MIERACSDRRALWYFRPVSSSFQWKYGDRSNVSSETVRSDATLQFIEGLERVLGRRIARRAPGRKPKEPMVEQANLL